MIELELPYPPSVNHYWRMGRGRIYLGEEGRRYKRLVTGAVRYAGIRPLDGHLSLEIEAYPPDHRVRDLDNVLKALKDALGKAGVYHDDSQVKHLDAWMLGPVPPGKVWVRVTPLGGAPRGIRISSPVVPTLSGHAELPRQTRAVAESLFTNERMRHGC
jgi:crossover junction endodeoxyribonuclease RusA